MAARNAPHAEPTAAQQAEAAYGLEGVLGARGMESAAGTEEGADDPLITADQAHCEQARHAAHPGPAPVGPGAVRRPKSLPAILCSMTFFHNPARLACSCAPGVARACGRALTTRSTAGRECWCNRNDSRMTRRMRLRSTALPAVRTATAMPSRAPCLSLLVTVTAKNPLPKRRPRAYAASNYDLRRSRLCGGKVSRCISSPHPPAHPRVRTGVATLKSERFFGARLRDQLPAP